MRTVLVVALLASGCGASLPTCAEMGCPYAPSGSPDRYSLCFSDECWCSYGHVEKLGIHVDGWSQCSQPKCDRGGSCQPGMEVRHEDYAGPDGHLLSICFCAGADHVVTVAE